MPKLPILSRTKYNARNADGSIRRLPWNLVNTSLGAMVEPVSLSSLTTDTKGGITDADFLDASWTAEEFVDEAAMYGLLNTWGPSVPIVLDPTA